MCEECSAPLAPRQRRWCSGPCLWRARARRNRVLIAEPTACLVCAATMPPRQPRANPRKYCSPRCATRAWRAKNHVDPAPLPSCVGCGSEIARRAHGGGRPQRWCSRACRHRVAMRRRSSIKRATAGVDRYTIREVGDRDQWTCHLCRGSVDDSLSGLHPDGPTIDHLVPLSAGGDDTPLNVALAHRSCNVKRGVRPLAA